MRLTAVKGCIPADLSTVKHYPNKFQSYITISPGQKDMASEERLTANLEAERAELAAVLQSDGFVRAPTLAHLLSYLCEKLFAGEERQIKEYSVGLEVFHRSASFDQNADSIVRVEANRLRKRLAAYYAGEGAGHRLRIVIPLEQSVPQFIPAVLPAPAE